MHNVFVTKKIETQNGGVTRFNWKEQKTLVEWDAELIVNQTEKRVNQI